MKKSLIALLALTAISLFGCGAVVEEATDEEAMVELASEGAAEVEVMPLRASFMSDLRTMAYTFDYDGNLLKLVDTKFQGASEYGASFWVEGGAEITTATYPIDAFVVPAEEVADGCTVKYASADHFEETLIFQLRVCEGQDAELGEKALNQLMDGLMMEWL